MGRGPYTGAARLQIHALAHRPLGLLCLALALGVFGCKTDQSSDRESRVPGGGAGSSAESTAEDAIDGGFGNAANPGLDGGTFVLPDGTALSGSSGDGGKIFVPPTPETAEHCNISGCPDDLFCTPLGFCITPPPQCLEDGDCNADQRCGLTGECLGAGACKVNGDCSPAESCVSEVCTVGTDCGQEELVIAPVPPNVLVLLDKSGSMEDGLACDTCTPSKMTLAAQAIAQMTTTYRDRIYWGLATFPSDGNCAPPTNVIVPAPGNEDTVSMQVQGLRGDGSTPINASIASIQASNYLSDPTRRNYLLFVSDGEERCDEGSDADTAQRIMDMAGTGINTFVVGFGSGVDPTALNSFALAGGVPNTSGGNSYFQADSASELETALGAILDSVVGCDFALDGPPDDPNEVYAFFDNAMIARDDPDGWSLDTTANQIVFTGAACQQLQTGNVMDIDIVFGCPEPTLD